jgi:hypothetical protein
MLSFTAKTRAAPGAAFSLSKAMDGFADEAEGFRIMSAILRLAGARKFVP